MSKDGPWNDSGQFWFCQAAGSWCEGRFRGRGVQLIGWAFDDGGKASVTIDGKPAGTFDEYGPGRDLPFDFSVKGLSAGEHTIRITVLGTHSAESKGAYVNVGGLKALP